MTATALVPNWYQDQVGLILFGNPRACATPHSCIDSIDATDTHYVPAEEGIVKKIQHKM